IAYVPQAKLTYITSFTVIVRWKPVAYYWHGKRAQRTIISSSIYPVVLGNKRGGNPTSVLYSNISFPERNLRLFPNTNVYDHNATIVPLPVLPRDVVCGNNGREDNNASVCHVGRIGSLVESRHTEDTVDDNRTCAVTSVAAERPGA
ncbi:hypothetical protein J6590_024788, partial [Homalodisca vitripennis]